MKRSSGNPIVGSGKKPRQQPLLFSGSNQLDRLKTVPGRSRSSSFSQMLVNQKEKTARLSTRKSGFQPRNSSSASLSSWIRAHSHKPRDLSVSPFGSLSPHHLVQALTKVAQIKAATSTREARQRAEEKKKEQLNTMLVKISSSLRRPVQGFISLGNEVNPGVYTDKALPHCRIVRHRFSFPDLQSTDWARRPTSRFKTVILIDGSAYWNTSYFSQAVDNAKSMLQDSGDRTWQFIVMNHPCLPTADIPSIHRLVQSELCSIVSNRVALHIGPLFLLGYSAGANIAIKEAASNNALAAAFTRIYAVSPVPDLTAKSISDMHNTMLVTKARDDHNTRSAADVRVPETFIDLVKFAVSSEQVSSEFMKCELTSQQADRVREKLRFILPPKDTERGNGEIFMQQHGFSKMPILNSELVWVKGERDHAAFWVNSRLRKAILDNMKSELVLDSVSKYHSGQQFNERGSFATFRCSPSPSPLNIRSQEMNINSDENKNSRIEESKDSSISTSPPQLAF